MNNAGVTIYGQIEEVPLDDVRRLFDTNYWGVVNGSPGRPAAPAGEGGALINVGSVLSGGPSRCRGTTAPASTP